MPLLVGLMSTWTRCDVGEACIFVCSSSADMDTADDTDLMRW